MRFHLLGIPNYITGWETAPNHPGVAKIVYMSRMLHKMGHEVFHYGVEGSVVPLARHVDVVRRETFDRCYGDRTSTEVDDLDEGSGPAWDEFISTTRSILAEQIATPGEEFLLNFLGRPLKPITDSYREQLICIEAGIGYPDSYLPFRVFQSYAWRNYTYGLETSRHPYLPGHYDAVIPAYFDETDYPFRDDKEDYFLFLGRIIWGKGVSVAVELTRVLGKKLLVIGGGDLERTFAYRKRLSFDHVEHLGLLPLQKKVKYLAGAKALIAFSLYVEPFGQAAVEAMLCGTPVLSTDFGAFPETNAHGLTGYRATTMDELFWGAKRLDKLSPGRIREYAVANYGLAAAEAKYAAYFRKVYDLRHGKAWTFINEKHPNSLAQFSV